MTRFISFVLVGVATMAAATVACSSDTNNNNNGKTCTAYTVPPGTDLNTPAVTWRTDVVPIMQRSCGISSSCHQSASGTRVYLPTASGTPLDLAEARKRIVDVPSTELPAMPFVKPGDPANSFLMRKMDGDQCALTSQCKNGDCGSSMPDGDQILTVADRDKVRRWIAQGAKDN